MARNVVITGANRGIGLGLVEFFLQSGDTVIATARDPGKASDLAELSRKFTGRLFIETLDVKSDVSVAGFAAKLGEFKQVDILVNNAGIMPDPETEFTQVQLSNISEAVAVNTLGPIRVTQKLLPLLQKAKQPAVANITSKMGSIADNTGGGYYSYRMSKAALNMFNKSFSIEFPNIVAVVLHPGWVKTDMGGSDAPLAVKDSAKGLGLLITALNRKHTGKFLDFTGKEIPW